MLESTFCHLPGIGLKTERRLWAEGFADWLGLLRGMDAGEAPIRCGPGVRVRLEESLHHLQQQEAGFFAQLLPADQMWRLFHPFCGRVAYVDIETTGLGRGMDHITSIALYDGLRVATYVHGRNLEQFEEDISAYQLVVTFNGSLFDLPFLRRQLRPDLPRAHIDLRFVLKSLGVTGGLKRCEERFGLGRATLGGMDGYAAVLLWQAYEATGREEVLETLLAYNVQDVLSLEVLLHLAYNMKLDQMGSQQSRLHVPALHGNPYRVHPEVLRELRLWR
ncbi:MAG: ribonuclease H-like domain-containing protein [Desulfohalobiaceae bacterium]|nr:ribonuclease H-like domain-containing protein [Desulfohalobiaceae bacterium]